MCVCAIITIESFASTQILFSFLSRHFFVFVDKLAHDVMRFLSEKQQKRPKFMPVEWMKFLISALFINYCLNCGGGLVGGERRGGGNDKGPRLPRIRPRCAAMTSNKIRSNQQRPWDDEWFQFGPNRATIEFRSCSFHHHASYSPTLLLPLQPNLIFESRNRKRRCLQRVFECCERVCRTAIFERRKKGPFPAREPSNEKLMTSFSF